MTSLPGVRVDGFYFASLIKRTINDAFGQIWAGGSYIPVTITSACVFWNIT